MNTKLKWNPCLAAGLFMELIYLCTDHMAVLERLFGDHLGSFLCGVWQGLAIGLLLLGLVLSTPKGQAWLERLRKQKKG